MVASVGLEAVGQRARNKIDLAQIKVNAFNTASNFFTNRLRANMRIGAANQNIAAIRQDQVTNNAAILDALAEAQADAKVAAAVTGTTGGSVKDVLYKSEANAGLATADAQQLRDNEEASHIASIFGAAYDIRKPLTFSPVPDHGLGDVVALGGAALSSYKPASGKNLPVNQRWAIGD
jgi:hypothetical protein